MEASEVRRRLLEVAGGVLEVSRVSDESFLVVGQGEAAVARMAEDGLLVASGAILLLQRWSQTRGTIPNPSVRYIKVIIEGIPVLL